MIRVTGLDDLKRLLPNAMILWFHYFFYQVPKWSRPAYISLYFPFSLFKDIWNICHSPVTTDLPCDLYKLSNMTVSSLAIMSVYSFSTLECIVSGLRYFCRLSFFFKRSLTQSACATDVSYAPWALSLYTVPEVFLMKTEAKKTLRTSPLSVSGDITPFAPQQAHVYSFPVEIAFIFTCDVSCQFQI